MFKKISLPAIVTVMCVMISVVLGLAWVNQSNNTKNNVQTEQKFVRTDYSSVARKTLDWIDQQRNADGWYILERGCDFDKKTCDIVWDNEEGNKDGLIATWARFNFYEQTKNPNDLAIVKSDINKFYEKYPNGVDNALWICKITYDMWKSDEFDQATKDKLEKICFDSKLLGGEGLIDYWSERDVKIKDFSKSNEAWKTWEGYRLSMIGSFDAVLGYSNDLLYQYLWNGDKSDLSKAEEFLSTQNELLLEEKIKEIDNICLIGLNYLDFFEKLNKPDYLTRATEIYDKYIDQEQNKKVVKTPFCGLYTKKLFEKTESGVFIAELESNNKIITKLGLDGDNVSVVNDGAFFTQVSTRPVMFKSIVNNALITELLRN